MFGSVQNSVRLSAGGLRMGNLKFDDDWILQSGIIAICVIEATPRHFIGSLRPHLLLWHLS